MICDLGARERDTRALSCGGTVGALWAGRGLAQGIGIGIEGNKDMAYVSFPEL